MTKIETIISLAKRRGFVYPGSEIYGGLAGTWDYGPLGVLLKNNIKDSWWRRFVAGREDMYGIDSAILMNSKVWEASGHLKNFGDLLVECKKCHKRFREDQIPSALKGLASKRSKLDLNVCPECREGELTEPKGFNTMFKTFIGAAEDTASEVYLRPETAQGIFVNFKNIIDSFHPKLPFGIAQIGKAFRNEISPRDFLFRAREFEQMEIEYFIKPPEGDKWQETFDYWLKQIHEWFRSLGIKEANLTDRQVPEKDRAHYSKKTIDIDYNYPFEKAELAGLAYRTDFDLKAHGLDYYDEETKKSFAPHVIEPSFGIDRLFLALLSESYAEDELNGPIRNGISNGASEKRVVLKLHPKIAPIKIAVFPLLANKPELVKKAREVFESLKPDFMTWWDDIGNIGKRYRRQDEIGTPWCVTVDFDTLEDDTVTVRDRDTAKQERVAISELVEYIKKGLK